MLHNQKYTKEKLTIIVQQCTNLGQVLTKLNLFSSGGNYSHISKLIKKFNIDTTHFRKQTMYGTIVEKKHWSHFLVLRTDNRRLEAKKLRRCLIEYGKEYKCETCGNKGLWNNKKLILQVDHIDSNKSNNVPTNLRFLCPNCHTQTSGYAGSKNKIRV